MWIDDFGHPSVRVSQQLAQESELSIQPLSSETTWLSTVSPEIISRVFFIISPAMFIFISVCLAGGNVHIHFHEEKCYDEEIFFYHLGCHQWVSAKEKLSEYESEQNSRLLDCTFLVLFIFLTHYILFGLEMVVIRQPNKVHFVYVDEISTKCLYAPL